MSAYLEFIECSNGRLALYTCRDGICQQIYLTSKGMQVPCSTANKFCMVILILPVYWVSTSSTKGGD